MSFCHFFLLEINMDLTLYDMSKDETPAFDQNFDIDKALEALNKKPKKKRVKKPIDDPVLHQIQVTMKKINSKKKQLGARGRIEKKLVKGRNKGPNYVVKMQAKI